MLQLVERGVIRSEILLAMPIGAHPTTPNQASAVGSPIVQVLRVGKFNHPKYGEFEITPTVLSEMKSNFDNKIRGVDIAFDYFHNSDQEASGWPNELFLTEDGSELWARVDWTPTAQKKLQEREIRYFSPDFAFEWQDPETGITYNNVLFGGGLTNRPFVKDMAAIVAAEERDLMTLLELEKKLLKLSEDQGDLATKHAALQAAHSQLQGEHAELKKKLGEVPPPAAPKPVVPPAAPADGGEGDDMEKMKAELAETKKKLAEYAEKSKADQEAKQMAEKETKFTVLLTEGKACAAQKEAFMKNDMESFVKLAEKVNLSGQGSSSGANDTGGRDERIIKLAEEKMKADPKLSKIDALTVANREVK